MPYKKRKQHHKRTKHRHKQTPTFTKTATDLTRMAVTGLVGAGLIGTTEAAIKNLGK